MNGISDMLDFDMEDIENTIEENSLLSSVGPTNRKTAQVKKPPKKRKPVTMPKAKSRVTKAQSDGVAKKATKTVAGTKRKVLEEHVNNQNRESESEDELEPGPAQHQVHEQKGRPRKQQRVSEEPEELEVEQTPVAARSSHAQTKAAKAAPRVVKKAAISRPKATNHTSAPIAETQLEQEHESGEDINIYEPMQRSRQHSVVRTGFTRPQDTTYRRRAGSTSDTERGDPNLRRRLGDVTLKFENVDLKYRNLKEVGVNEATANVDRMRKQCEAANQKSAELIASLKAELAMKAPLAQDARKLVKEMQAKESEMSKLQTAVSDLTKSLNEAQNEIKVLQAKLSASRNTPVEGATTKTPGSAVRNNMAARTAAVGSTEASQATQAAQMKENLYGDLTGLIIRSVKKTPEGDSYDCIQTGRNGTLHFKLYVDEEDAKNMSFEETEFLYTPLLDVDRDREMIELMPDYLRDEITFARQNAAKFYSRVVDTLTKRRVDE